MDITLKSNYGIIFIAASILLALVISYFYYRRSSLEGFKKKLFTVLRFFSLFFIFTLLSSPVISILKNSSQDPVNAFLIDVSQSLLIDQRDAVLKGKVSDELFNAGSGNAEDLYFLFSGELLWEIRKDELDKITFAGINNFETNLTNSFYSLRERLSNKNLSSVTVISDGILNEGGNPVTSAKLLNAPINYILIGDTLQKNDLVLRNVFYNKTSFIESSVPVNIEVNSFNFDRDIRINLYEEDNQIQSRELRVSANQIRYDLSFNVSSTEEKIIKYKIEIEGLTDEITLKNNFQEFFVKFIDNRFKILVLSGGPGADFAFISEEIRKVKNFDATFRTQKSAGDFYEGTLPDLADFDAFMLIGFPTNITDQNLLNEIRNNIEKSNSSLIFFASRNTDHNKLTVLQERLPFKTSAFSDREELTGIRTAGAPGNEIFKNKDLISSVNSFPNIFKTSSEFSINPSAETFLVMNQNSEPALVIQNTEKNKSAAFLAYGLYKWRLDNQKTNAEEVLNYIITNSILSVTDKEEKKSFTVGTTRPVYSKFENVRFIARITNFELKGGEMIRVKITGDNYINSFELVKTENRYFTGELKIPDDGVYTYTAELISENNSVESIENKFAIGENNFEYKLTRSDKTVLNNLSNETNGIDFSDTDLRVIKDSLANFNLRSESVLRSKKNFELNMNPYYLGIIIFFLCLEWFLRKRNNLP